jgi:glycosyltransferase involved in cell wall biosynthesis
MPFIRFCKKPHQQNDWGLILLGDGDQKASLQAQIERLNLQDFVKILPNQPWFRVPETLALADVLVLPSLSEPWGLVVNEAMACGMPVVVSNRCGCAIDLVKDGQNGYVFDPLRQDRVGELASAQIHRRRGLIDRNGARISAEIIGGFTPDAVAREMLAGFVKVTRT